MISGPVHQSPSEDFLEVVSVFGKRLKSAISGCLSGVLLWLYLDQRGTVLTARTYGRNPPRQKKVSVFPCHDSVQTCGHSCLLFSGDQVPKRGDGSIIQWHVEFDPCMASTSFSFCPIPVSGRISGAGSDPGSDTNSMTLRKAGRSGFISFINSLGPPVLYVQCTSR